MLKNLATVACIAAVAACASSQPPPAPPPAAAAPAPRPVLRSGIDLQYVDSSTRPQDDVYQYLNGKWLRDYQLPADKGAVGSFTALQDKTEEQLRTIVDGLGQTASNQDPDAKKLADLYASYMNESELESLGVKPVLAEFAAINAIKNKNAIPAVMARMVEIGAGAPFGLRFNLDARDSTRYAVILSQDGLGLPDRDYYLKDDAKLKEARVAYRAHIEKMLGMAGQAKAAQSAAAILELETALARIQWTRVEDRNPIKTYNKTAIAELPALMPGYDWQRYLRSSGVEGKVDYVIVTQPSYFTSLSKVMSATPLHVWKAYFKWRVLSASAPYMSKAFVDERFAFSGGVLRGVPENQPRWKRGINLLDASLGEALGKLYVAKYFPPQNKARMQALILNLLEAYRRDIDTLDWMSADTKVGAQAKLAKMLPKIGYPDHWRDYGALKISRDDLLGNVDRANEFEYRRNLVKLGKPVDHSEWRMRPQTINASYNPTRNEITFPAAILQPPFFDSGADDAVNYGGIGGAIGHEMSHGFDDEGSQFDADGNLHDWFTKADHDKFAEKTRALVAQYNAYEPVPGYHVNGALTLGENIGDNSGLAIAYKAYRISLAGHEAPVIDGLTGDQRLYLGWVQVWRGKVREAQAIERIKTDPHSPPAVRGTAPLRNQAGFYAAFGLKPGDKMYLPPDQRVSIW
ncbi:MAG TPA: M13-type metalloendopeptidase [Steroidobacteraceae bacterium]|jgi:predicted metalloendopeptidase|nr:M13-type metalloendopeptidase [Steroidobacteraceae bacterium]